MAQSIKVRRSITDTRTKRMIHWNMAKCRGMDTTMFFDPSKIDEQKTRAICRECPILIECFVFGMTQAFGTWGGATEQERRVFGAEKQFTTCMQCGHSAITMLHAVFKAEICCHCGVWCEGL